ncbi:MAG: ABC transporter ATP-binding protein [Ilumatobacteraceae bacterium]|nr:ABC transporter ATP-binding protein [Ilumatobacteraceae bacterium]
MTRSAKGSHANEDLPPAMRSLVRTFRLGYRAEPRLLALSLGLALLMMLPDALLALWLKFLVDGVLHDQRRRVIIAGLGLAVSVTATWYLSLLSQRVQRRFRDRVAIALESHVAHLQASVPTIEHHERPEYLDRLAMLRDQVFALDHMFMSLFSTLGWLFRLAITAALLGSIHPVLVLLMLFALPAFWVSTWRPAVERRVEESVISNTRLARHLFVLGTTAPPAKEVRVTNTGDWLATESRAAWKRWYVPVSKVRWATAAWHTLAWAVFAGAYIVAVVFVATGLDRGVGDVVLVLAAGTRLARYVGATAGELGFLRGFWLDSSRRLTWLEDYAAGIDASATASAPERLTDGISFEHISFSYPGTDRLVLDDITLRLPAGSVVAVVGENGAGKSTLVKLVARMYSPTSGRITIDGTDLADIASEEWRACLAGAFQDFYRFELHAQQTVGVGDLPRVEDRGATRSAVDRAGADDVIERLAYGLETQLGPSWDEGAEVSFGQWQKLALARGFMRDAPLLLILDEPTAALDAETEHAMFERFAEASQAHADTGRVTVLVSHRFSTVRMADLIVVMDGSHVAEFGTHEELMARDGQYAELFRIQAAAYG